MGIYRLGICGVAALLAGGAALAQTARSQLGSGFQIEFGVVENVEVSQVDPTAAPGQGAAIGGMLGYAAGRGRAGRAAAGAAAGGLISNAIARNQKANAPNAYTYTIMLASGATSRVITDTGGIDVGDCVSVESGGDSMNVRRVSSAFCEEPEQAADPEITADAQEDAAACQTAKESALNATTEEQMNIAYKKVRLFCES